MVLLCFVTFDLAKSHMDEPFVGENSRSEESNEASIKSMSHAHRTGRPFPDSGLLSEHSQIATDVGAQSERWGLSESFA